jgi:hypothetical protein
MFKPRIILFSSISLLLTFANTACKKDTPNSGNGNSSRDTTTTGVNALIPANPYSGDTVKITGRHLGTDVSQFQVSLTDTLPLQVYQAKDSFVTVILPSAARLGYFGTRVYYMKFNRTSPAFSTVIEIHITARQPRGWFQLYRSPAWLAGSFYLPLYHPFLLFNDSVGLLHGSGVFQKTMDGGATWTTVSNSLPFSASYIAATDVNTLWVGDPFTTSSDGGKTFTPQTVPAMLGSDFFAAIDMTSPTTGRIAGMHGELYLISGTGFDTATNFSLDYKSKYWDGGTVHWVAFSAIDNNNLMAVGYDPHDNFSPLVTIKTNGVYDEYSLPTAITTKGLHTVQLVNNNLAYVLDNDNNLLKYTGYKNWSLLAQKANCVYFTNATNGYIDYQGEIFQTSDGGQTWTGIFAHGPQEAIVSFVQRNGMIWAVGANYTANYICIYKYNP